MKYVMNFGTIRNGGRTAKANGKLLPTLAKKFNEYAKEENAYGGCIEYADENNVLNNRYFERFIYELISGGEYEPIETDLSKINVSIENMEIDEYESLILGYHKLKSGLEYIGFFAGGDGEEGLYGIIYHDGKNLRAYIPVCGNTYNIDKNEAFYYEDDGVFERETKKEFLKRHGISVMGDVELLPNEELMLKDIEARIVIKP